MGKAAAMPPTYITLKKAALLLKERNCKINEVCYMVGFNTPSYFAKCFQKQFGMLPKDFGVDKWYGRSIFISNV